MVSYGGGNFFFGPKNFFGTQLYDRKSKGNTPRKTQEKPKSTPVVVVTAIILSSRPSERKVWPNFPLEPAERKVLERVKDGGLFRAMSDYLWDKDGDVVADLLKEFARRRKRKRLYLYAAAQDFDEEEKEYIDGRGRLVQTNAPAEGFYCL